MDRVKQLEEIHQEALELFKRKNKDYGDAFADFGLLGILVRLNDKIKRAITITENSISLSSIIPGRYFLITSLPENPITSPRIKIFIK